MKKNFFTLILTVIFSVIISSPACIKACDMSETEPLKIVYFGGSATTGWNECNTWMNQVTEYFEYKTGKKVAPFLCGEKYSGSKVGKYRAWSSIVENNPDIVFLEFSADDVGIETTEHMESIIRSIIELENVPYVYFILSGKLITGSLNYLDGAIEKYTLLAEYYNIPIIDMAYEMEMCNNLNSLLFDDCLTLTQDGHNLYANEIIRCMESEEYISKPDYVRETLNEGVSSLSMKAHYIEGGVQSNKKIYFRGTALSVAHTNNSVGSYYVNIDGVNRKIIYTKSANDVHDVVSNLTDSVHTVEIIPVNSAEVKIYALFTDIDGSMNPYIYEDYEDGKTRVSPLSTALVKVSEDGANGSNGCLDLCSRNTSNESFNLPVYFSKGSYRLSCYVKTVGFVPNEKYSSFSVVFWSSVKEGSGNAYNLYSVNDVEYVADEWVRIETVIENDGYGTLGGKRVEIKPENTGFRIRVGDKNSDLTNTYDGNPIRYMIDDLCLEPLSDVETEKINVIDLENDRYAADWSSSNTDEAFYYIIKILGKNKEGNWYTVFSDECSQKNYNYMLPKSADGKTHKVEVLCMSYDGQIIKTLVSKEIADKNAWIYIGDRLETNGEIYSTVRNCTGEDMCAVGAFYSEDGRLISCEFEVIKNCVGAVPISYKVVDDAHKLKIMAWKSIENMKPVIEAKECLIDDLK